MPIPEPLLQGAAYEGGASMMHRGEKETPHRNPPVQCHCRICNLSFVYFWVSSAKICFSAKIIYAALEKVSKDNEAVKLGDSFPALVLGDHTFGKSAQF